MAEIYEVEKGKGGAVYLKVEYIVLLYHGVFQRLHVV